MSCNLSPSFDGGLFLIGLDLSFMLLAFDRGDSLLQDPQILLMF